MNCLRFGLAALVPLMIAAGCSHNQKLAQAPAAKPPSAVAARPAPPPKPAPPVMAAEAKNDAVEAIYFDFDSAVLRNEARPVLQGVAESALKYGRAVEVDGNCDELGTVEYNLALGEQRARAAKDYLLYMGVPEKKITTLSYGSQRPKYDGHDETAHAKNRRDDLIVR